MLSFELWGYIAGICTAVCFLPQTIRTIRTRNVSSLSLLSYLIYGTGLGSWIIYGIYLHSRQMVIFNTIALIFALIIIVQIITRRRGRK